MIGQAVGNYRIVDKLGRGGMGVVYLAEHSMMGKKAAVKVLLPEFSNDKEVVGRFFNEAKAAARIRHPGIVDVFDFGFDSDGGAYISMELLEGESLAARLDECEQLEEIPAVRIARQAARALSAAHKAGIIHRDLKPDNVFLLADPEVTGGERVKILDFGIAKLTVPGEAMFNTRAGMTMGTPYYMSPEQARGSSDIDARSDIYSLGCVLYHTVCGTPPFVDPDESSPVAILRQHINEPPPPTSFHTDGVSAQLEGMLMVMLAKHPDDRFQSMDEVVAAFDELGYDIGTTYGTATPVPGSVTTPVPGSAATPVPGSATTLPGHPAFVDSKNPPADNQATLPSVRTPEFEPPESASTAVRRPAVDSEETDDDDLPTTIAHEPYRSKSKAAVGRSPRRSEALAAAEEPASEPEPTEVLDRPPRSRAPLYVVAALLLLAIAAGAYALFLGGNDQNTAAEGRPPSDQSPSSAEDQASTASTDSNAEADRANAGVLTEAPASLHVEISSTPPAADVFRAFDGVRLGKTPFETTAARGPGDLVLVVKLDGYQDARLEIPLDKDFSAYVELMPTEGEGQLDRAHHHASRDHNDSEAEQPDAAAAPVDDLPRPDRVADTGSLRVVSEPSCEVIVDGKARGSTPIAKIELGAGKHTLQLVNSRFGIDQTEKIEIHAGEITKKRYVFPLGDR